MTIELIFDNCTLKYKMETRLHYLNATIFKKATLKPLAKVYNISNIGLFKV